MGERLTERHGLLKRVARRLSGRIGASRVVFSIIAEDCSSESARVQFFFFLTKNYHERHIFFNKYGKRVVICRHG